MEYVTEFVKYIIKIIIDAIEEFFDALIVPSTKFTFDAFLISLVFLGWSIFAHIGGIPNCVSWQEALTCSILMLAIVLIDTSVRSSIKSNITAIKQFGSKFTNNGEEVADVDGEITEESIEEVLPDE